jgi:flavin reductase (DIM6/NTAB) family NADH-FMN oxidoreductase RutF
VKSLIRPKMLYFGTPVVLISSLNPDGSTNLAPMSSAWWLGNTAVLGMSINSQTVRNLSERPDVVLNLVDSAMVGAVDRIALLTGRADVPEYKQARGYTYQPDKFAAAGLTPAPSDDPAKPAAVTESLVHLEGRVRTMHAIGDDAGARAMEVAITDVYVDDDLMMPEHPTHIDAQRWDPLIMKFTQYFGGGSILQHSSLADGWDIPQRQRAETEYPVPVT